MTVSLLCLDWDTNDEDGIDEGVVDEILVWLLLGDFLITWQSLRGSGGPVFYLVKKKKLNMRWHSIKLHTTLIFFFFFMKF